MSKQLTADDFKQSLNTHVASKAEDIHLRYGPYIGWEQLQQILQDRSAVRYPCEIVFDAKPLLDGEIAHAAPNGDAPEAGFKVYVHPFFRLQLPSVPLIVLYQLVRVNYGEFASADDAETFGAGVLGMSNDDYYATLCGIADQIGGNE